MSVFNVITLLGGLAMFLYGMRLMGDGLKRGSSGALKKAMEHVTNNPLSAFFLGLIVTAIIQSSTATIVITAGLVGAGIISLRQSLGIIIGANVGTTVTGQIIRLLDLDTSAAAWLQVFKPSTLAPVALIIGILFIMFINSKRSRTIGDIAIGFGILFSGLMTMTSSVDTLHQSGLFEKMFFSLGENPVLGYVTGAGVAFILQSSSATIGILQALSTSGLLKFSAIYSVIVGIYLGDCVTTAIVCSIGAKSDAKRVGIVNILFNLSETVLVLLTVTIIHKLGLLDGIWDATAHSGMIANTNTIFNLGCAVCLFPAVGLYEKLSRILVKDEPVPQNKYQDKLDALSPAFFKTPALAFRSCYNILLAMFQASRANIEKAMGLLHQYDEAVFRQINEEEENVDMMTDRISAYLVEMSPNINDETHAAILDQYYKVLSEFERLSDHAVNIAEVAADMNQKGIAFSPEADAELHVIEDLIARILDLTELTFEKRNAEAASHIEPLEEVVDDMVNALKARHINRLYEGKCNIIIDNNFMNLLSDIERISDVCSNVGIATLARVYPEKAALSHGYISSIHSGDSAAFNEEYKAAHEEFFARLGNEKPED